MGLGMLVWAVRGVFDIIFVASWVGGAGIWKVETGMTRGYFELLRL
jgi:hypothetical protein